ncbi:hypothetical protein BDQ17DRAFT_1172785, partial [Cyathus striatus]
ICSDFQHIYLVETGKSIKLCPMTLNHYAKEAKSLADYAEEQSWLKKEEVDTVIDFIGEMADCGWPLSPKWLKEHVDMICHAHLGDKFPASGVGKNWTCYFSLKYS